MKYTKNCAVWLVVLALVFALALTGCGKDTGAESAEEEVPAAVNEEAEVSEETTETVEIDTASDGTVVSVTLLVNEDEDGTQSVAGAAVEYSVDIDTSSLSSSDFSVVSGNTEYYISDIYTNNKAAFADEAADGCFVILELTENASEAMADPETEQEGPVAGENAIQAEVSGPAEDAAQEAGPEVTPYFLGEEDENVTGPEGDEAETTGPEGWDDPNTVVITGSSPDEEASGEILESDAGNDEDMLSVTVGQVGSIRAADQTEIGGAPAVYESTAIAVV